ncbi:MAG: zinc ribbon domain-containing protein, partial [bacterium]|nr:zinc ribbon domain-containing protein [bacterium]
MPMYEFSCKKCGNQFEELFFTTNIDLKEINCPACSSNRIERLMSATASTLSSGCDSCSASSCSGCSTAPATPMP